MHRLGRLALMVILGSTAGCVALPVAALGVAGQVTDIGSTAFSAGTEVFTSGKLESVEFATFDQAQQAIRWMLNDYRLRVTQASVTKVRAMYEVKDEAGSSVKISLLRRSAAICGIRVDVGWFGSEAYARLLLKSIRGRLPAVHNGSATQPAMPIDLSRPALPGGFQSDDLDQ